MLTSARAFSFIELMVTLLLITALSGMGMAVYSQYQVRAYSSSALQSGLQLRTAFEAGMSDRSSSSASLFDEARLLVFNIDGQLDCLSGCSDIVPQALFPGFNHNRGLKFVFNISTLPGYSIQAGHCKALSDGHGSYNGWLISDEKSTLQVAFPASVSEVEQCSDVLTGIPYLDDTEDDNGQCPSGQREVIIQCVRHCYDRETNNLESNNEYLSAGDCEGGYEGDSPPCGGQPGSGGDWETYYLESGGKCYPRYVCTSSGDETQGPAVDMCNCTETC